jgi:hypothetical protein
VESLVTFLRDPFEFFVAKANMLELTEDCREVDRYELICLQHVHKLVQEVVRILPDKAK